MPYAELVHWLKTMDPQGFEALQSAYRASMRKLYDKDLRRFFESARFRVSGSKSPGGGLLVAGSTTELAGKNKAKQVKYDSFLLKVKKFNVKKNDFPKLLSRCGQ